MRQSTQQLRHVKKVQSKKFSLNYFGLHEAIIIKTKTSIVARNYQLQEWAQMVQECKRRPYGMSVSEWCQENSITTANYYYRMSQVRKACMDSLPAEAIEQPIVPVPTELMNTKLSANGRAC